MVSFVAFKLCRFRILVVGKVLIFSAPGQVSIQADVNAMSQQVGSGKSSLIKTVFKVDMTVRIF